MSVQLTRRVGSARKRSSSGTNLNENLKKTKLANRKTCNKPNLVQISTTKSYSCNSERKWIQNSFIACSSNSEIQNKQNEERSGEVAPPRQVSHLSESSLICESQEFLDELMFDKTETLQSSQVPCPESSERIGGEGVIMDCTPRGTQQWTQFSQGLIPASFAVGNYMGEKLGEEPYASQHDSFNESDSLFADIDIPESASKLIKSCERTGSSCKKKNKLNKQDKLPPTKLAFGCVSQTLSPRRSSRIQGSNVNNTNKLSLKTTVRPLAEISSASNNNAFDSDEALLANIDLNQITSVKKNPSSNAPNKTKSNNEDIPHENNFQSLDNKQNQPDTVINGNTTVQTPVRQSIVDRLKHSLNRNSKLATPPASTHRVRLTRMLEAEKGAELVQQKGTEVDIGPFYGLPAKVQTLFESVRGISKLYDWQEECLSLETVLRGGNLIYSLPTSGGKTLVAEILILRQLLCQRRDAVLVLPFVAIVQEKVRGLSQFAVELDLLVEEYAGSKGAFPPKKRRNRHTLYICTIEKASSLVNSLIETERISELGLVVIDELHMLGDGSSRGATLEMTLIKLLHCAPSTQLIGMSATLNNIRDLQDFLHAVIYTNDFRPVKLTEHVKLEDVVYEVNNGALCPDDRLTFSRALNFQYDKGQLRQDPDMLTGLVQEVIPHNSCLLFCPTKKNCENVAELLSSMLPKSLREEKKDSKKALLRALREEGQGSLCLILQRTVPYGIAYHHSGLTADERRLIEEAYSEATLCLLCCTSTLAAGVNLPAKRVILRSPYVGAELLSRSHYKQMVGRAGRAGLDSSGESILIVSKKDKTKVMDLISGPCEQCHSSLLYEDGKGMRALLLAAIGLKVTPTRRSVAEFVRRSLCHVQASLLQVDVVEISLLGLRSLIDLKLVVCKTVADEDKEKEITMTNEGATTVVNSDHQDAKCSKNNNSIKAESTLDSKTKSTNDTCNVSKTTDNGHSLETTGNKSVPDNMDADEDLSVTDLGRAVFKGSVDIDRGSQLYADLLQARESLCVASHLHLLYLVTPYDMVQMATPNWMLYLNELSCFEAHELKVASLIGVSESNLAKRVAGHTGRKKVDEFATRRFYLTLVLYGLWRQQSVWSVATKFQLPRGFVQQLLASAAAFASCVARFCEELSELWAYQDLLSKFVQRLSYCVTMELIPLMEIPGVKQGRARQLFSAGYRTLAIVAHADPDHLVRDIQHMPRRTARQIVAAAKMLLAEKAETLRDEAANMEEAPSARMPVSLELELGTAASQRSAWSDSQLSNGLATAL